MRELPEGAVLDSLESEAENTAPNRTAGEDDWPFRDFYAQLEVTLTSSQQEIAIAFRRLTLKHHPDKCAESQAEISTEYQKRINEAYTVLRNPVTRAKYDAVAGHGAHVLRFDPIASSQAE